MSSSWATPETPGARPDAELGGKVGAGPAAERDAELEAELRTAVERDELVIVYQPEVDLPTGEIVAVEALVRWQHPSRGELDPEWFIALAEGSDLIELVGNRVLDHALATLAAWRGELPGLDLLMRVNFSPVQLAAPDLVETISAALGKHDVPGRLLCAEITERVPLGDVAEIAAAVRRLKSLGVRTAIDDLATGYSALSHLRSLPVDYVKIDRSLISGIDTDRRAQMIVIALIGLGLNFELGVVAEGVETAEEAATLLQLGCTRAQGHHLGRPVDSDIVVARLRDQRRRREKTGQ